MNKLSSNGNMLCHQEVEHVLHTLQKDLPVVDIQVELPFDGIVDEHAGLDIDLVVLTVPVGLESYWDAFPSLRIVMP